MHRDAEIASMYPLPIRRRTVPPALPSTVAWDGPQEGRFLLQDVYRGLEGIKRGSIESVRVIGVPPKVQPRMNEPSRLTPGPEGSWPLRFDRLVGPVLERHCVKCHRPDGDDAKAARFDLTASGAYDSLLNHADKDLHALAFERHRSIPGEMPARRSKLLALLTTKGGHEGVKLGADDFRRMATWMDLYAQRQGHFSDEQAEQLEKLRETWAGMIGDARSTKPTIEPRP